MASLCVLCDRRRKLSQKEYTTVRSAFVRYKIEQGYKDLNDVALSKNLLNQRVHLNCYWKYLGQYEKLREKGLLYRESQNYSSVLPLRDRKNYQSLSYSYNNACTIDVGEDLFNSNLSIDQPFSSQLKLSSIVSSTIHLSSITSPTVNLSTPGSPANISSIESTHIGSIALTLVESTPKRSSAPKLSTIGPSANVSSLIKSTSMDFIDLLPADFIG